MWFKIRENVFDIFSVWCNVVVLRVFIEIVFLCLYKIKLLVLSHGLSQYYWITVAEAVWGKCAFPLLPGKTILYFTFLYKVDFMILPIPGGEKEPEFGSSTFYQVEFGSTW